MKKSARVFISGTVQGVFFRQFIKENAEKLNIKGYVRNLEDGRVETWIEGSSKEVNEMIKVCNEGPPHSSIRRVDVVEEKVQSFKEFRIIKI